MLTPKIYFSSPGSHTVASNDGIFAWRLDVWIVFVYTLCREQDPCAPGTVERCSYWTAST